MGRVVLSGLLDCAAIAALAAPPLNGLQVAVRTVEHERLVGELQQCSTDTGLVLQLPSGEGRVTVAPGDVVQLTLLTANRTTATRCCVLLQDGDKLCGRISEGASEQIILDTLFQRGIALPLDRIRACLTDQAVARQWRSTVRRMLEAKQVADQVLLSNGDSLAGLVIQMDDDELTFEQDDRTIRVELDRVVAIVMAQAPQPAPPVAPRARVHFVEESTLTVSRLEWSGAGLDLTFFNGSVQGIPSDMVQSVEMLSSRWTWLSDLQPLSSEHTPALTLSWPHRVDRDVTGGALTIAGRTFDRGFGVHSRSALRFELSGQYRLFTAVCGLDDSADRLADVTASIVVDGQTRWRQEHIRAESSAQQVRIDVHRARVLELHVGFGDNGDVQDRFNWADAALIR